jgi:hypothetical protein
LSGKFCCVLHCSLLCFTLFSFVFYTVLVCVLHCSRLCFTLFSFVLYTVFVCVLHCSRLCFTLFSFVFYTVLVCVLHCSRLCFTLFSFALHCSCLFNVLYFIIAVYIFKVIDLKRIYLCIRQAWTFSITTYYYNK